jgi:hypothetical protein
MYRWWRKREPRIEPAKCGVLVAAVSTFVCQAPLGPSEGQRLFKQNV